MGGGGGVPDRGVPRARGLPVLASERCIDGCRECIEARPTGALSALPGLNPGLGRCLFCTDCVDACPTDAVRFTSDYRLSANRRENLVQEGSDPLPHVRALEQRALR